MAYPLTSRQFDPVNFLTWCLEQGPVPDGLLEEIGDRSAADWWNTTGNSGWMLWLLLKRAWRWNDGQRAKYINATADERAKFYSSATAALEDYVPKGHLLPVILMHSILENMKDQYESCELAGVLNDTFLESTYLAEVLRSQLSIPSKIGYAGVDGLNRYEYKMVPVLAEYRHNAAVILRSIVGNPFITAKL